MPAVQTAPRRAKLAAGSDPKNITTDSHAEDHTHLHDPAGHNPKSATRYDLATC
jgi:hypothetical protein